MTKHAILFIAAFIGGTVIALAVRSALFKPYVAAAPPPPHVDSHVATAPPPPHAGTVNTICPICAMDVDPSIPPATYKGQQVGFGCRACPPIFARDPDRYGPAALANEVAGN